MLRGGVCKEDRWFVLELLRLDFHLCDLSFDRHRSGSEKGVHPLHPRLLGTSWRVYHSGHVGTPGFLAPPLSWHPYHSGQCRVRYLCFVFCRDRSVLEDGIT